VIGPKRSTSLDNTASGKMSRMRIYARWEDSLVGYNPAEPFSAAPQWERKQEGSACFSVC
jgi:hypothetical protein